ncbi:MAG TPA: YaaA family protein, partial [Candidatus Saccharimonadales bacterium]
MTILIHSSKTMRQKAGPDSTGMPQLLAQARQLDSYLKTLSVTQLAKCMHVSPSLAAKTHQLINNWTTRSPGQSTAIDSFVGDIYSGLQVATLSAEDRQYANKHLRILSGLYGILRPLDTICPYRLEMGYKLPDPPYNNLYAFWGNKIAACLPSDEFIINASSVEYSQVVTSYVDPARIITPKFLTIDPKTKEPTFVVVHAKIARGALAHWLIKNRIDNPADLPGFNEIGYEFNPVLSTPGEPVFVAKEFK